MGDLLRPFTGYLPTVDSAPRVVGPPVAKLSPDQREALRRDPLNFRYMLGRGASPTPEAAAEWLASSLAEGVIHPVGPAVLVYRIELPDLAATGVVADVSVAAFQAGRIKRHEKTRTKTLRAMAAHMQSVRLNGNPVALAHRPAPPIDEAIAKHSVDQPHLTFVAADGVRHSVWIVGGDEAERLCELFTEDLYVTDGHHRLAAAATVASVERADHFVPVGVFGMEEMRLRAFTRCVVDPHVDAAAVIGRLDAEFELEPVADATAARPNRRGEFGMVIEGDAFLLNIGEAEETADPLASLDVVRLQELILRPIFGIHEPRVDERLHFVPDTAGPDDGLHCDAWFLPYPASVEDVMRVADAGEVMPPKSTWFEPKLPSGLVIQRLEGG